MRKLLMALPIVGTLLAGGIASADELVVRDHDRYGTTTEVIERPQYRYDDYAPASRREYAPAPRREYGPAFYRHRRWIPAHFVRVGWHFERVPGHWVRV